MKVSCIPCVAPFLIPGSGRHPKSKHGALDSVSGAE